MTVPAVQYLLLRKELPYGRFLGYTGIYAGIGLVMLICVRLTGRLLPWTGWAGLAVQVAAGMIVYGLLCLPVWKSRDCSGKEYCPEEAEKTDFIKSNSNLRRNSGIFLRNCKLKNGSLIPEIFNLCQF